MAQPEAVRVDEIAAELEALRRQNADLRDTEERLRVEVEHLLEGQDLFEEIREQYAELYDTAPVAWLTLATHGEIRGMNRLAARLFGLEPARALGAPLATFVAPEHRRQLMDHLLACRDTPEPVNCELRFVLGDAVSFPARLVTRREPRNGSGYACAIVDLRELEESILERDRLEVSEREARAANLAKDQFIAMLSHELRTPLTPVLAAASALVEAQGLPTEVQKACSIVRRNVLIEVQLIDDLLDVARIANGKMHIDRAPLDVHAAVREALEAVAAESTQRGLKVVFGLDAARSWVAGDARRLQQVFSNLLRNAVKFTPPGGQIEVRTWNHQRRLLIEVSDTGRGIDQGKLARLFDPFEQVVDDNSGSVRGLGLGLAICRGIVSEHAGTIVATSAGIGRGSRFVIELSTIDPPLRGERQPTASRAPASAAKPRILLVEDHEDTAEILAMLLARGGFEVKVASSVSDALAVEPAAFDVLLSDVGLRDGSGLDLMRALRQASPVKGIALSGYGTEEDVRASKAAGFASHITKPVDFDELIDAIARLQAG